MRELTYNPLFLPMLVLERRDLETGLPDDTYARVNVALQQVLGAAQFPQSPNMRASVSFEVREFQEALRFDTLFRNLVDQFAP